MVVQQVLNTEGWVAWFQVFCETRLDIPQVVVFPEICEATHDCADDVTATMRLAMHRLREAEKVSEASRVMSCGFMKHVIVCSGFPFDRVRLYSCRRRRQVSRSLSHVRVRAHMHGTGPA
jgi:hypothetical protein